MLDVLHRLPATSRKPVAVGLLFAAFLTADFGLLMAMGFSEETTKTCHGHLWAKKCVESKVPLSERLTYLLIAIALVTVAAICVLAALRIFTMQGGLKKYQAILTGVESIGIQRIADITNTSKSRVYRDIQGLIDSDEIPDFYIDYQADQVVSRRYVPGRSHKTVVRCSSCGASNELIVGITKPCGSCGEPLLLQS